MAATRIVLLTGARSVILRVVRLYLISVAALVGCSDLDVLQASFADELVEAQARTVDLKVIDDAECPNLLRVEHRDLEAAANVIAVRQARYPIDPASGILKDLPRNRPLVFDLSVLDRDDRQVARACQSVTLPDDATEISLTVRTLPDCGDAAPDALDVAVVLDASLAMRNANVALGSELEARLTPFFDEPLSNAEDRYALVVHGPTVDPDVTVPFTTDRTAIVAAIRQATSNFGGDARLYDATRLGTVLLRASAVCGRRPVLLMIAGGADAGPLGGLDLAVAGLAGDRNDPEDNLVAHGVAISATAKASVDLVLDNGLAVTQAALTAATLSIALEQARARLRSLVRL